MKMFVSLFMCAVMVATINAKCYYCNDANKQYRQEIEYGNLKSLEQLGRVQQNADEPNNMANKFRIIENIIQNYPKYEKKSKQAVKFSNPLNLIDSAEFLSNGVVEYKNAVVYGLDSAKLTDVNFDAIDKNSFSVKAIVKKAIVSGDYSMATNNRTGNGQYEIKLTDVKFEAQFPLIGFLDTQQEIGAESITCDDIESTYTDEGLVLRELRNENAESLKVQDYYGNYLYKIVKDRLAKELTVSFMPTIAKRLQQKLYSAVLFPTVNVYLPQSIEIIAPDVQAKIFETLLYDLKSTNKIQKMINSFQNEDKTEMMFFFSEFDLRGNTRWNLDFTTGTTYEGGAMFAIDNIQTVIMVTKSNARGEKINLKFTKTSVNGLSVVLNTDDNCKSIRNFAQQCLSKVLEHSLKDYINQKTETVLKNQMDILGEKYQ